MDDRRAAGSRDSLHHDLAGEDILAARDRRFAEYRRQWEENPKGLVVGRGPLHLDIEVTSFCNLRCSFCKTTYSKTGIRNGYMEWETARKVLDEAGDLGVYACKFNFRGEPLLHKELPRFISYAKERGLIDVFFNTNAVLLDGETARRLIDSGLDRLTVSFEGFEKEMYEKSRVGAKFEEVVANVEGLRNLRERLGASRPKVRVQAVLLPELEARKEEFVAFWKDRADQVSYNEMLDNVPDAIRTVASSWVCPFLYQRMMVMWDGTLTVCYNDHFGKLAVGNVRDTSIEEGWGKGFGRWRDFHREGNAHRLEACAECPLRMSEIRKRGEA